MCNGTKQKPSPSDTVIDSDVVTHTTLSPLLELAAFDDLAGFQTAVEQDGLDIDEPSSWYGRRTGSKRMSFENRTPLMVASTFASKKVLTYILESGRADVNRSCGSDHATALHCAVAGSAAASLDAARALLRAGADVNALDINGNRPLDLIPASFSGSGLSPRRKLMESLLKSEDCEWDDLENSKNENFPAPLVVERREYPVDLSLPDIKNGIYGTDEFRMYMFKIKPCSRAYSHDWTECPFVHPGENARRRDPRKYHYSCVPCPEFRKGVCRNGDNCDYAHGIFECWLHPAQYRTRLCKDETGCTRRVCFFAHRAEELRPLYASTGSGLSDLPSPRSYSNGNDFSSLVMPNCMNYLNNGLELDVELVLLDRQKHILDEMSSRAYSSIGMESSAAAARAAAFARRSQSFVDRGTQSVLNNSSSNNFGMGVLDWGLPDGKLDWGIKKDELNKLRKSASFGFRSSGSSSFAAPAASRLTVAEELDVSWVQSLVKDGPTGRAVEFDEVQNMHYLFLEQEQVVA